MTTSLKQLEKQVEAGTIDTLVVAFPDPYGRLLGKRVPAHFFLEHIAQGELHACDYLLTADMELNPLPGFAFTSWDSGYGDMVMKPDLATLRLTPWLPGSALVLCDLEHEGGGPLQFAPRQVLKGQLERIAAAGFVPQMASELEFYTFKGDYAAIAEKLFTQLEPTTRYIIDYHILGTTADEDFLRQVRIQMPLADIPIESSKGEWGRGQHEINVEYADALTVADRHVIFKEGVKLLAQQHGVSATFMAKVDHEMAGSSCHIHTSLLDGNGKNAFWDEQTLGPSVTFRHFLAGCMHNARHLSWFFAPLINSYKRYQATSFAPVSVAWDDDNRTCGFRVVGHGQSLRIENRIPGADVNPYLALAATLAAGLDGIERQLEPPPATKANAYETEGVERVPATLMEAIATLAEGGLAKAVFGEDVWAHYLHFAKCEQAAFDRQVTDFERTRYFERG